MSIKKVEVLYILTKLELGGAQKICLSLMHHLQQHNIPHYLITGSQGLLVNAVKDNKNVILLDSFTREVSFNIFAEFKNFIHLVKEIKKLKKDNPHLIVHTHSTKAGLIGRWAALCAGIKTRIHTIHGFAFHKHQSIIKNILIFIPEFITSLITTHFVCVSSTDVRLGKKLFPRFNKKHSIIRAAVEWDTFYQPARVINNEQPFIFGTIACFKKQKNLFDLLEAFNIVYQQNNDVRLEIIGDGHLRPLLEQWLIDHQLQRVITLHGWQSHVAPIMLNWHAFVLSSLWEGLPCAIVEARLLKLPVLAYDTGGIKDIIFNGKNGFLYQQKDTVALSRGMLELSLNKQLQNSLSSFTDNLESFKDQTMAFEHIQLYSNLSTSRQK